MGLVFIFFVWFYTSIYLMHVLLWEMLTIVLRALVYELFLKTFYWENDKTINIVDNFLYFP